MSDSLHFDPHQLAALRATIGAFEPKDRARGQQYFRSRAVLAVLPLGADGSRPDAIGFKAEVEGSHLYEVLWELDPREGWGCSCSCTVEIDCKHAYAAALTLLERAEVASQTKQAPMAKASIRAPAASPPPVPTLDTISLTEALEKAHGRVLTKAERAFVGKLERLWSSHRHGGTFYVHELADVSLADRANGLYYEPVPALHHLWETPPASALELWQYLAFFAERAGRPIAPLMKPVTDTDAIRGQVEAAERRNQIRHWKGMFERFEPEVSMGAAPTPASTGAGVSAIRLRLARPKLVWEYQAQPAGPWSVAKGPLIKGWFATVATQPTVLPPAARLLLQQVQVRRMRPVHDESGYYMPAPSTEPQTLRIDDASTTALLDWLLMQPELREAFVNEAGEPYDPESVELVWIARPSPARADDVEFQVCLPDGTALPRGMTVLQGRPRLGFFGRTIYRFPPVMPGFPESGPVQLPIEAMQSAAAARHLRASRVRAEGVALPVSELVQLQPAVVCRLEDFGLAGEPTHLCVDLQARSADARVVQRWNGATWTSLAGKGIGALPRSGGRIWEVDPTPAERALPLLAELRLQWMRPEIGWSRAITKTFPEEFAAWAEMAAAQGIAVECDPLLAGLLRPPDRARIELSISTEGGEQGAIDWFDLQLVVRAEDTTLTDAEIALLLKARGRFVRLAGKGWRRLQLELDDEQSQRLAELGLDATLLGEGGDRQRYHALQLADERIAGLLPEQHAARVRERAQAMRAIAPPAVPVGLTAELRPYQQEGFHFLAHLSTNGLGGVLADDMGLGKTVQALAWLLWLDDRKGGASTARRKATGLRALVVCPKSVVTNWENEARRFAPGLPVTAWSARDRAMPESGLVVVNYTQLRLAADALGAITWDAVILDEGQNIKNPQSQTAKVARDLRAAHRLVLTGTPIENRVLDLWSLFAFAMPGLLGGQAAFKRTFNDKTDPLARGRLARRVHHFMLRRTKAQVAQDLPPRIEEDLVVELEPAQRKLYEAELKRARQMLLGVSSAREFDAQRFNILQSLLRLRQICCDPRLLGAETRADDSAKLGALLEQVEPILEEGHKVLIFSQFVSMLELVQPELSARGIRFLTITGQTENRQELVDEFQQSADVRVFLLSLKAAGAGLNLTAASYVVLFDPWWNPAVEAQAIDRTHRIGQQNQVIAYRLIAKDSVEEKIRALQRAKAELARAVVQEESLASVMNLEDLRYVLG